MDECSEPKCEVAGKVPEDLHSCFTIQEPGPGGLTELAERIGVTKSNIHNILSTFTSMGYLDRLPDGRYTLGLKILEYAFIINQNLGYPNAVYDILVDTAGKTNEIVYFGLPYGTNVLYLYVAHPANRDGRPPLPGHPGGDLPLLLHWDWQSHSGPHARGGVARPYPRGAHPLSAQHHHRPGRHRGGAPPHPPEGLRHRPTASGTPTCGVWVFLCTTLPASWWPG